MMGVRRGMTIAECVMAFGLLGVMALALVGLFSRLLATTAKTTDQTAARILARGILEHALREGPDNDWGGLSGRTNLKAHDNLTGTDFVYEVKDARLNPPNAMGNLYQVTVVVTWWKKDADPKATYSGLGKLSVELTGSTYVRP